MRKWFPKITIFHNAKFEGSCMSSKRIWQTCRYVQLQITYFCIMLGRLLWVLFLVWTVLCDTLKTDRSVVWLPRELEYCGSDSVGGMWACFIVTADRPVAIFLRVSTRVHASNSNPHCFCHSTFLLMLLLKLPSFSSLHSLCYRHHSFSAVLPICALILPSASR